MSEEKLTIEERHEILLEAIEKYSWKEYYVLSQTETTAQMQKDKSFSILLFLILLAFGVLPGLIYLFVRSDKHAYITVDNDGDVDVYLT